MCNELVIIRTYVVEDASLGSHFGRAADSLSGERTVAPL
jgi:hypothetical protein